MAGETELRWQIAGATVADVNAAPGVPALLRVGSIDAGAGSTASVAAEGTDATDTATAATDTATAATDTAAGESSGTASADAQPVAANVRVMVLEPGLAAVLEACATGSDCDSGAAAGSGGWSQAAALPADATEVLWRVTVLNTGNVALTDVRVARAAAEGGLDTGTIGALEFGDLEPGASARATAVTRVSGSPDGAGVATKLSVSLSAGFAGVAPDGSELANRFTDAAGTVGRVPSAEVSAQAGIGEVAGEAPSDAAGTDSTQTDAAGDASTEDAGTDNSGTDNAGAEQPEAAVPLVQGVVRLDRNGNGAVDDGDDGIGGVVVSLYAEGGEDPLLQLWTGPDGSYQFPRETIAGVAGPYSLRLQTTSFEAAEQNYTPGNVFLRSSVPQLAITMTFTQGTEAVSMDGLVQSAPPPRGRTFASTAVNCPVVPVTFDGDGALFPYIRTYMPSGTNGYLGGSTTLAPAGGGSSLANFFTQGHLSGYALGALLNNTGNSYYNGKGNNQVYGSQISGGVPANSYYGTDGFVSQNNTGAYVDTAWTPGGKLFAVANNPRGTQFHIDQFDPSTGSVLWTTGWINSLGGITQPVIPPSEIGSGWINTLAAINENTLVLGNGSSGYVYTFDLRAPTTTSGGYQTVTNPNAAITLQRNWGTNFAGANSYLDQTTMSTGVATFVNSSGNFNIFTGGTQTQAHDHVSYPITMTSAYGGASSARVNDVIWSSDDVAWMPDGTLLGILYRQGTATSLPTTYYFAGSYLVSINPATGAKKIIGSLPSVSGISFSGNNLYFSRVAAGQQTANYTGSPNRALLVGSNPVLQVPWTTIKARIDAAAPTSQANVPAISYTSYTGGGTTGAWDQNSMNYQQFGSTSYTYTQNLDFGGSGSRQDAGFCGGVITVNKRVIPASTSVTSNPTKADLDGWSHPADGWQITAQTDGTVAQMGNSYATPSTAQNSMTGTTGTTLVAANPVDTGEVDFQYQLSGTNTSATVQVTETQQTGYTLKQVGGTANAVCTNDATGATVTVTNVSTTGFTIPVGISNGFYNNYTCTLYNQEPLPNPQLTITKALDGARKAATDQFTVGAYSGTTGTTALTPATGATPTTTGTGATVTAGTGSTGTVTVPAGSVWRPQESASGTTTLSQYAATVTCTDVNNIATGLPTNAAMTGGIYTTGITLPAGANVSCVITNKAVTDPTLTVTKQLSGARVANTDQFTVGAVDGLGVALGVPPGPVVQPTTSGTGSTVTSGTGSTGAVTVTAGTVWKPRELTSGTTNLAQYTSTVTCTDASGIATGLPTNAALTGGVYTAGITLPAGANVTCVITNTALQPTLQVTKALSGARVANTDQFTVGAYSGTSGTTALTPATGAQTTTTGSGATVTANTGTTGVVSVPVGSVWRPREAVSGTTNLLQYTSTVTCTDANGFATGLPTNAAMTGGIYTSGVTLPAGAKVSCVITNTVLQPTLQVTKTLSGARVANTDQFTVGAYSGTSGTTALTPATGAAPTTTGTGSTVTANTGTTGVVTVATGSVWRPQETASGTTNLPQYTSTVSCTDASSLATGLPTNAAMTGGIYTSGITLPAGAKVSCVITNTQAQPTLQVSKVMGDARVANTDQFTVGAYSGTSGTTALTPATGAQTTTTGSGATVTANTGTTGVVTVPVGSVWRPQETAASGSTTNLAQYASMVTCTDANGFATGLPTSFPMAGGVYTTGITIPAGANVSCVITNRVVLPSFQVTKALSGARVADTDQFTVGAFSGTSGTTPLSPATSAQPTTTGTGSTVTAGTGTTGLVAVPLNSVWRPQEVAASGSTTNLIQYTSTVTCTDTNGIAIGLPTNAAMTGGIYTSGVTLPAGARVTCVITNTQAQPTLQVTKALDGARAADTDQFTVGAYSGTSGSTSMTPATGAQPTTAGSGSTITANTGTTGVVSVTAGSTWRPQEVAASGSTTNLTHYTSAVSCTDANNLATGLPTNQALTNGVYTAGITVPAGAKVSCVITNRVSQVTTFIEKLAQNNANEWVQFEGSQWQVLADAAGSPGAAAPGVTVTAVSGQTALFQVSGLTPGTPYWLVETQTPDGFSLLAEPVQFTVASDGSVSLGASAGPSTDPNATVQANPAAAGSAQAPWWIMSVRDVPNATLPAAGGTGEAPIWWGAGLLLAAGAVTALVTWRRRAVSTR